MAKSLKVTCVNWLACKGHRRTLQSSDYFCTEIYIYIFDCWVMNKGRFWEKHLRECFFLNLTILCFRRVVINSEHEMPSDYGTTPGGTIFGTTPGGIQILFFYHLFWRENSNTFVLLMLSYLIKIFLESSILVLYFWRKNSNKKNHTYLLFIFNFYFSIFTPKIAFIFDASGFRIWWKNKNTFFSLQAPKLFMNEHFWWNWKTVPLHVPHQPIYLWFRASPPPKMPTESLRKKSTKRAKWLTICPLLQVCIFICKLDLSHSYKLYLTESTKEEEEMDQFDMDIWKEIQNQSNAKPHTTLQKNLRKNHKKILPLFLSHVLLLFILLQRTYCLFCTQKYYKSERVIFDSKYTINADKLYHKALKDLEVKKHLCTHVSSYRVKNESWIFHEALYFCLLANIFISLYLLYFA